MKNISAKRIAEFEYNPDDAANDYNDMRSSDYDDSELDRMWQPVYDAVEKVASTVRCETRDDLVKVMDYRKIASGSSQADTYVVHFDSDGNMLVQHRFVMINPDDEDFETPGPFVGRLAAALPPGFDAEYARADETGSRSKFIGDKMVVRRFDAGQAVGHLFGDDGVADYDVIETLVISPKKAVKPLPEHATLEQPVDEADGDVYICDFPAWALDYVVNAELGSVSRQEKQMIDGWTKQMERGGFNPGLASYGEDEFFSGQPEFGLPCDCVTATVPKKAMVAEAEDLADPVAKYLTFA